VFRGTYLIAAPADARIGRSSLTVAIAGLVVPVLIAAFARAALTGTALASASALCLLVFAACEVAAAVLGVRASGTAAGRAGLGIAVTALSLLALSWA
jgi:hypothetical protein